MLSGKKIINISIIRTSISIIISININKFTVKDSLRVSSAPVIFSHSGARGVNDHVRNVPDEILLKVSRSNGSLIAFFSGERERRSGDGELLLVLRHQRLRQEERHHHGRGAPILSIEFGVQRFSHGVLSIIYRFVILSIFDLLPGWNTLGLAETSTEWKSSLKAFKTSPSIQM